MFRGITVWEDFFTGTYTNLQPKEYQERQTPSGTGVYVSNSLFKSITSTDNGGALCCTSATYLLVESSSFFSCKTSSNNGGAIYFSNGGGQCVLYEVCGYDSISSCYGQFAYIEVSNAVSSKNYVNYSSITRCVNELDVYRTVSLLNGKICCPSVNISMNKCRHRPGIYCQPYSDSGYVTCSLTYSTFADNNATYYMCIRLYTTGAKYEMKSCNVIRNTQVSSNSLGTICTRGYLTIDNSCILGNVAPNIICQESSYTITVSNCTIDTTSNYGNVITQSTVTKSFILALNHMSTRNCYSEYDSDGTLTPIIQTPSSSKKQNLCYSHGRFFYQLPPQTLFISLYFSV
jgi:hypothetical protein